MGNPNEENAKRIAKYKEQFKNNLQAIYKYIPDMKRLTEDEINSYFSEELLELHDRAVENYTRGPLEMNVPSAVSRLYEHYRYLPDSEENIQKNNDMDSKLNLVGPEGDRFRKELAADVFNMGNSLDSKILGNVNNPFKDKLKYSLDNCRAVMSSVVIDTFRKDFNSSLNITEKTKDSENIKNIQDKGIILGGVGRGCLDFASKETMFLIPYNHLTKEQAENLEDILISNEKDSDLMNHLRDFTNFTASQYTDQYKEPSNYVYTAEDFNTYEVKFDDIQKDLTELYNSLSSVDDDSQYFWSSQYIKFFEATKKTMSIISQMDGSEAIDRQEMFKELCSSISQMTDLGSIVSNRLSRDFPEKYTKENAAVWEKLKPTLATISSTKSLTAQSQFNSWMDNAANIPERIESLKNIPDEAKNYLDAAGIESKVKIGQTTFEQDKKNKDFEKSVSDAVMITDETDSRRVMDQARLKTKKTLEILTEEYLNNPNLDDELRQILRDVSAYSKIQATSSDEEVYLQERKVFSNTLKKLDAYMARLEKEQTEYTGDFEDINNPDTLKELNRQEGLFAEKQLIAENINLAIKYIAQGRLEVPKNAAIIDTSGVKITNKKGSDTNYKNEPLFPHDPCPEDINQGALGDCYMLAGLSSIAAKDPEKIKECMVDNGDGTVTVRFFSKGPLNPETKTRETKPVYVTVDKIIPEGGGSHASLWVQTMERAYVASGIHLGNPLAGDSIPENWKQQYEDYKKMDPDKLPSHIECPWLIDADGKLHEWQPDYQSISAGHSSQFVESLLGDEYNGTQISLTSIRDIYIKNNHENIEFDSEDTFINVAIVETIRKENPQFPLDNVNTSSGNSVLNAFVSHMLGPEGFNGNTFSDLGREYIDVALSLGTEFRIDSLKNLISGLTTSCKKFAEKMEKDDFSFLRIGEEVSCKNNINSAKDSIKSAEELIKKESELLIADKDNENLVASHNQKIAEAKAKIQKKQDIIKTEEEAYQKIGDKYNEIKNSPRVREFLKSLSTTATELINEVTITKYSGNYSKADTTIWEMLKENIHKENIINCGTPSENENKMEGVVLQHAHSVLGVYTKKVDGKDLRFVRVRNPHGAGGKMPEYTYKEGKIDKVVEKSTDAGYSDIELSDFISNYDTLYLNGKLFDKNSLTEDILRNVYNRQEKPSYKDSNEPDCMDKESYKQYMNSISKIVATLRGTGKTSGDSTEYTAMLFEAECALKSKSGYLEEIAKMGRALESTEKACNSYIIHCEQNHKFGSRRATRKESAKALKDIVTLMKEGKKNPVDCIKENVAKKFIQTFITSAKAKGTINPAITQLEQKQDIIAKNLIKDPKFKKIVDNKNIVELCSFARMKPHEIGKAISGITLTDLQAKTFEEQMEKQMEQKNIKNEKTNIQRSETFTQPILKDSKNSNLIRSNTFDDIPKL